MLLRESSFFVIEDIINKFIFYKNYNKRFEHCIVDKKTKVNIDKQNQIAILQNIKFYFYNTKYVIHSRCYFKIIENEDSLTNNKWPSPIW